MNRRQLLYGTSIGIASSVAARASVKASSTNSEQGKPEGLKLSDYQPTSMLHARETRVERARYPVIDIHTHITESRSRSTALTWPLNETSTPLPKS